MKELSKYFDHYTINARFKPVFFTLFPFVLTMMIWCPQAHTIAGGSLTLLISFGVMFFLSTYISNLGNECQQKLFKHWGGAPTTSILRFSDTFIDIYTKRRYHMWFNTKIEGYVSPTQSDEVHDPIDANSRYLSAINFLREYTRDKKVFPSVYRDNTTYGFARNLFALRKFGMAIAGLCVVLNSYLLFFIPSASTQTLNNIGNENLYGVAGLLFSILFFVLFVWVVNSGFVKIRGYRYAKSLLESCEIH